MSQNSPTSHTAYKTGFRLRWRAKLAPYPKPIRYAGFTLIELSIVLVIIGLIVGGVLVGQSLIEAAKLRAVASDFEKYNTAINTFKLKYNCLPGDCKNATTFGFASNGDGDKTIDMENSGYANTPLETFYLWQHLGSAGLIGGTYSGTAASSCYALPCHIPGTNVPKSAMGDASAVNIFYYSSATAWTSVVNSHAMIVGQVTEPYAGRYHNEVFTPAQQLNLDQKFDDGLPYQGLISDIKGADPYTTPNCTTSEVVATAAYNLSLNTVACMLVWKAQF